MFSRYPNFRTVRSTGNSWILRSPRTGYSLRKTKTLAGSCLRDGQTAGTVAALPHAMSGCVAYADRPAGAAMSAMRGHRSDPNPPAPGYLMSMPAITPHPGLCLSGIPRHPCARSRKNRLSSTLHRAHRPLKRQDRQVLSISKTVFGLPARRSSSPLPHHRPIQIP